MRPASALRLSRAPAPAFAAMGLMWGSFAAFVPQLKAALGAGDAPFGAALLGSALGLLLSMWLAPLADRRLGARALPLASGALSASFLLPAIAAGAGSLPGFAAAMFCVGLCSGLTDVVMNARVSEIEARSGRSLMNLNHGLFSVAYAVSALATGAAREAALPPLAAFAALGLCGLVATRWMRAAAPAGDGAATPPAKGPAPRGVVLWGGLIVLLAFLAENAAEGWSALHVERTLGGRAAEGALGPAMLGATMAAGRLSGQLVAGRLREARLLVAAALLAAAGAGVAALAAVPATAYLGFALFGLGISVLAPMALALVGRAVPAARRTQAISRTAVLGFLGFFIAPPLMGLVSEALGLRAAFGAVGLLLLAVPLLLRPLRGA